MNYAKLISETAIDRNPPRSAVIGGRRVSGQLPAPYLASLGYYPLDESPAPVEPPSPGLHWEARYALAEGRVAQSWAQVADPPSPPRSLSKVRLMRALKARGLWLPVKAFIAASETFADEWELSTTLDEDHELVKNAVGTLRTQLGLDDATVAGLLNESVAEE